MLEKGRKVSEMYLKYGEDIYITCKHCSKQIKVRESSPIDDAYPKAISKTMESLWCPHCDKKLITKDAI